MVQTSHHGRYRRSEMCSAGARVGVLVVVALGSGLVDAVTLRSRDSVCHAVNATAAAGHSAVLNDVLKAVDKVRVVPLSNIANTELEQIVEYIHTTAPHEVDRAVQWAQDKLRSGGLKAQCHLLAAANFLAMHPLMVAIAATKRTWKEIAAMRGMVHDDLYSFVVDNAPGIACLRQVATKDPQRAIAGRLRDCFMADGNVSIVNDAPWDRSGNVLQWAARQGEQAVVDVLVDAPGIDVNALGGSGRSPFHDAVVHGHLDVIRSLLTATDIDVNLPDAYHKRPLHRAAAFVHDDIVALLLTAPGIDVNARDLSRKTPLHVLGVPPRADTEYVARSMRSLWLLANAPGIDLNARDANERTPLHSAVAGRRNLVATWLLNHPDVDVNTHDRIHGRTPLHTAVANGETHVVAALLNAPGADVNARDMLEKTPLHLAVVGDHDVVVALLLCAAAVDVNAKDYLGRTPLHLAVRSEYPDSNVLTMLLNDSRVDLNAREDTNEDTPLHTAVEDDNVDVARLLVSRTGIAANARDHHGKTPLFLAVAGRNVEIVQLLLSVPGVDVNAGDADQLTPLFLVATSDEPNDIVIVNLLLAAAGIDVNARDRNGATPLHFAAIRGYVDGVQRLLGHPDIDVNAQDGDQRMTALHFAIVCENDDVAEVLLGAPGIDGNARDRFERTPLHLAAALGRHMVAALLANTTGVTVNADAGLLATPLHVAALYGHRAVVDVLLSSADVDVTVEDDRQRTALDYAAALGHDDIAALISARMTREGPDADDAGSGGPVPKRRRLR
ncbi:hypothetical protein PBRA_005205 [Plasmodiophora brassicae]|uniref:Uncharacterized protein n=1 Tax=Plasmodiophora brassicae TaxID=37360 RepID=A0A0G4IN18_PLABS|nr:hypothetical protein PBRA_005205 [Plasmodiophora brassicae]